jgi:fructose/tagatose bisphosphate aldolase
MSPYSKFYQTHLSPQQEETLEQHDIEKLLKVVEESLEEIARITALPMKEVLHIVEQVDVARLAHATQEAIRKISIATDLDRARIVAIFKEDRVATVPDIVHRLRETSHVHRARV